jgi:membrane protease YdiL (CAAX protease family)
MKSRVIQTETSTPTSVNGPSPPDRAGTPERQDRNATGLAASIKRHPLLAFFVIAFALTWWSVPFGTFMAAGPLLAALIVIAVVDGRPGLRRLWSSMVRWRVGWRWYAAALLIPFTVVLGAGALNVAFGASSSVLSDLGLSSLAFMFGLRLVVPFFAPVGEEPGWRGYALPRLQARHSTLVATSILAVVVTAWHVPLIFLPEEDLPPIFLITTVAVTFFYTWLYNHTGASVFMTIIAHAAEGTISGELVGDDGFTGSHETRFAVLYTLGWCIVAVAVLVLDRPAWRNRLGAHDDAGAGTLATQPA